MGNSDQLIGFIACLGAVFGFGTNFMPVKKFKTGDGLFFQWIVSIGILMLGIVVYGIRGFPKFEPFAMLGGALWCTGNLLTVPIIKTIGLGLGLMIWGMFNLATGWLTGTFGLFDLDKDKVPVPWLNYLGFTVALISIMVYVFVEPTVGKASKKGEFSEKSLNAEEEEEEDLIPKVQSTSDIQVVEEVESETFLDRLPPLQKRIFGVGMSMVAGILYGANFDPPQYLIDSGKHSTNSLDYVFPHFVGIFLCSTFYFLCYIALKKNRPEIFSETLFPALVSGAFAQTCWFIANEKLSFVVSFPIITTGPGALATLLTVIFYREIQGARNFLILGIAYFLTIVAVVLIALSKVLH